MMSKNNRLKTCRRNKRSDDKQLGLCTDSEVIESSDRPKKRKQNLSRKTYRTEFDELEDNFDFEVTTDELGSKSDTQFPTEDLSVVMIDKNLPFPELVASDSNTEGRIKCGKCRFGTNSEAEMILHSINHTFNSDIELMTTSRIKCPTCDRYLTAKNMRKHVYIHTSENPFKCKTCGLEFTNDSKLVGHQKSHSKMDESADTFLPTCDICGSSFGSNTRLRKHKMIHSADRPKNHICDNCNESFYDKESLKAHTIRFHEPKASRRFKCEFKGCRYTSIYNHQLLEHQRVHSDDKPFVCDLCQYSAKSKWTFRKHYRIHTKEKPFKCQICSYATSLSSNLTRHMRIHTGSKPFKCPYCSYSCNNHENLRKHVLSTKKHRGLYLYNCKHCQFKTNVFSDLRQHIEHIHKDIYTIEDIDRMISSIYHKSEDNTSFTTFVVIDGTNDNILTEDQNGSDSSDNQMEGSVEIEYILPTIEENSFEEQTSLRAKETKNSQ